ncbi:MAG: hypothetical protein KF823_04290 [Xanthomonadales bacterium]|nr:hypothetical protein [Xanthomonadales bacterium]
MPRSSLAVLAAILLCAGQTSVLAEADRALPLAALLDEHGYLSRDVDHEGPIDLAGWTLVSDPGQALRFGRGDEEIDGQWLPGYHAHRGCAFDNVYALARDAGGTVYVAGTLDHCDEVVSGNIFAFDPVTQQFSALGAGVNGPVRALAVHQGQLVVGGRFDRAGEVPVNNLARWTGSQWQGLAGGVQRASGTPWVHALASVGGDLYVGGNFDQAGSIDASNIARFSAGQWHALGAGTDNEVRAIEAAGSLLFVGGAFSAAGGMPAARLARWNGSVWSAVGSSAGLPSISGSASVYTLHIVGSDLWVGGRFAIDAGGQPAHALARWNSTTDTWTPLWGTEMPVLLTTVHDLAQVGSTIYVAGLFYSQTDTARRAVVGWNNGQWLAMHSGEISGVGYSLLPVGNQLLFGGRFNRIDGLVVTNLARWDGLSWHAVSQSSGLGLGAPVYSLVLHQGELIASGVFTSAGGTFARGVARRTADGWQAMDQGLPGWVVDLVSHGGQLFAAVSEYDVAPRVMRWNGSTWQQLGGLFEPDHAGQADLVVLASHGGSLYAGGSFDRVGAVAANNIARWNGSGWEPLLDIGGNGVGGSVWALRPAPDGLLVGGAFTTAGGLPAQRVARWSGSNWFTYGEGFNGAVRDLAVHQGTVYAAGSFSASGSTQARGIAVWTGSAWAELGGGLTSPTFDGTGTLSSTGHVLRSGIDGLWVGGSFVDAGAVRANRLALWTGSGWQAVGQGAARGVQTSGGSSANVVAMLVEDGRLHVGGAFARAGDQGAWNYAVFQFAEDDRLFVNGFEPVNN